MTKPENAFPQRGFAEQFLGVVASAMPLSGCCFYRVNGSQHVLDHQLFNLSPYWEQRYYHHFWRFDPLHPRRVINMQARLQVLSRDTASRDPGALEYYEQFLKPQNTAHQTELYFRLGSRIVAGASLLRSDAEGAFTEDNIGFLQKLMEFTERSLFPTAPASITAWQGLTNMTPREREIASLIGEALCNKEIGRRLNIELPTVKAHVSRVLAKAGARSRAEFIKKLQSH
jgi:DNA-binding CsgD family transcriptional regulator